MAKGLHGLRGLLVFDESVSLENTPFTEEGFFCVLRDVASNKRDLYFLPLEQEMFEENKLKAYKIFDEGNLVEGYEKRAGSFVSMPPAFITTRSPLGYQIFGEDLSIELMMRFWGVVESGSLVGSYGH